MRIWIWCIWKRYCVYAYFIVFALLLQCSAWDEQCVYRYGDDGGQDFDAFNDPVMGIIVAKTRTRWGRFRPWIFLSTVLNAVTIYALYATPESMGIQRRECGLRCFTLHGASHIRLWIFRSGL